MKTVAVVGHATLADAIFKLCAINQIHVLYWQPDTMRELKASRPEHVKPVSLATLAEAPLIFVCVPIEQLRATARALGDVITARHILVHACRELEPSSRALGSELLHQETPTHRVGFLTGPMRSADLEQGLPAAGTIASSFLEVHELVAELLVSPSFRLYRGKDLRGAELAAAYARAIAFVSGVAEAMQQGPSVKATIFARGLAETSRFVALHGAQAQTAFGMSGSGNLFADIQAPGSLAFNLGKMTMSRDRFDLDGFTAELGPGVPAFLQLIEVLRAATHGRRIDSNIFDAAYSMIGAGTSAREAAHFLMTLPVMLDE